MDRENRLPRAVLAVSMFVTGGCGLVSQYVLSTVSTYILGNSIEQFSVIIALTLLMMGIAGLVQKFISDQGLVEKFVATEIGIALLCGFTPLAMYGAYAMLWDHFVLVQYALILGVGFLIGLEIPLAIRINERYAPSLKANIANIWALDYVGSFVGALIWAFILIRLLPLTELSFWVGFFNLAVALLTLAVFWRRGQVVRGVPTAVAMGLATVAMGFGIAQNRPWAGQLEQRLYDDRILYAETTRYQRIVLTEDARTRDLRLFLNGNLQFSSVDEFIYHEQLVHPVMSMAPYRRHVLILGGGDGLGLREVLKYPDVEQVTLVDIDPGMIALGRDHPRIRQLNNDALRSAKVSATASSGIEPSGKRDVWQTDETQPGRRGDAARIATVDVFTVDAAQFLLAGADRFDVVIVDLPDPNSIELAKLYSVEFYRSLRERLSRDGLMVVQATSPFHAKEAFLTIGRTLREAGFQTVPYHDNVPSFGSWGWYLCGVRPLEERRMRPEFAVPTRYLTPERFRAGLAFGKDSLTTPSTHTSTIMRPTVLDDYIRSGWQTD